RVFLDITDEVGVAETLGLFFPKLSSNGVNQLGNQSVAQLTHLPIIASVYGRLLVRQIPLRRFQCLVESRHPSIELLFVDRFQDLAHSWARLHVECEKMPAQENRRRRMMLDAERAGPLEKPVHRVAIEGAGLSPQTVRFGKPRKEL